LEPAFKFISRSIHKWGNLSKRWGGRKGCLHVLATRSLFYLLCVGVWFTTFRTNYVTTEL
ncbi:MAG: hypothetical protein KHX29_03300, partial [Prevotella buccalis]|nr:hypothetical protein [Hoylesella buccalis]